LLRDAILSQSRSHHRSRSLELDAVGQIHGVGDFFGLFSGGGEVAMDFDLGVEARDRKVRAASARSGSRCVSTAPVK